MIIGDKKNIAIQFELNHDHSGLWMLGKFCFYINNQIIGLYDIAAVLSDIKNSLRYIMENSNKRYYPQLFLYDDRKLLETIIYACYDENATEYPLNFLNIYIGDECMDPFFIYAIDSEYDTKIIYGQCCPIINGKRSDTIINDKYNFREDPKNIISSIIVSKKEFDDVIKQAYEKLNEIYEQLKREGQIHHYVSP